MEILRHSHRWVRGLFILALIMELVLSPAFTPKVSALPSTIWVNATTTTDSLDGKCDLVEALKAVVYANLSMPPVYHECTASNGANLIGFTGPAAGGTIALSMDLPTIWGDTTLLGPVTIRSGAGLANTHVFVLASGARLTLNGVTITGVHTDGAGPVIFDDKGGTVNVIASAILNNTADNDAGAIVSNGTVNIIASTLTGNRALGLVPGSGRGGAILMTGYGELNLAQSNLAGNVAANGGGAIFVASRGARITDAVFSGNISNLITPTATGGGGAIWVNSNALLALERTAFNGNLSPGGNGGALYHAIDATVFITDTSFNANLAGGPTAAQLGGAIYNQGNLSVVRSAFLVNSAVQGDGGALALDRRGVVSVTNVTFSGNSAPQGYGGAVAVTNTQQTGPTATLTALNITFSANTAKSGTGHGAAIFSGPGQTVRLGNTLLDGSATDNCAGPILSLGHNLDSGTACHFDMGAGRGDINNGIADLEALGFNGGPLNSLLTQKLGLTSQAIDAGDAALCAAAPVDNQDQRASARPRDGDGNAAAVCDIGAFENPERRPGYGSTPVQPGPIHVGSTTLGVMVTKVFSAFNTGDYILTLSNPTLSGANAAEFGVDSAFPMAVDVGGAQRPIQVHCTPAVPTLGERAATLSFDTTDPAHPTVSYELICEETETPVAGFDSLPPAPGPVSFPETRLGAQSTAEIVIRESGTAQLTVSSAAFSGPNAAEFSTTTPFPIQIANGAAPQNLGLACRPGDVGMRSATLTLSTNDPARPGVAFDLTCVGEPIPVPYLSPAGSIGNTPDRGLNGAFDGVISPDGKNVYVSGNQNNSVTSFSRTAATGALSFMGIHPGILDYLNQVRHLTVSPDGKNVYAAGSQLGAVVTFDRDPATGGLSAVHADTRPDLAGADGVLVSPDNRFLYVTGNSANSVVVFSRDAAADLLTWVQTLTSTANLSGARDLALSPDGLHLYVAGFDDGTLAVYSRNATTGRLTWVQTRAQNDCVDLIFCPPGLDGMRGATDVVVSPDGRNVYLTGMLSGALVAFERNPLTGKLRHRATYRNGTQGVQGLNQVYGVAVTPDGAYVLTVGFADKAVALFSRDPENGLLTFETLIQRTPLTGAGGTPPLDGAANINVSPDGRSVYAVAYVDDAIVALRRSNPLPQLESLVPGSLRANNRGFNLTVNGRDFLESATVYWDEAPCTTTYLNSGELRAAIPGSAVATAGKYPITVRNPAPGGGTSNVLTFTVTGLGQNAVPSIEQIVPAGVPAGSGAFQLNISGSNFISETSVVRWNGTAYPATRLDSHHLQLQIPAEAVAQPGQAGITVFNGPPGGGTSNAVVFEIAAPGENPAPTVEELQPDWIYSHGAGSAPFTLIVKGLNFVEGATVQWNGSARPTVFVDSSTLRATIPAIDRLNPGPAAVSVINPQPGGGESNLAPFTVRPLYQVVVPAVLRN